MKKNYQTKRFYDEVKDVLNSVTSVEDYIRLSVREEVENYLLDNLDNFDNSDLWISIFLIEEKNKLCDIKDNISRFLFLRNISLYLRKDQESGLMTIFINILSFIIRDYLEKEDYDYKFNIEMLIFDSIFNLPIDLLKKIDYKGFLENIIIKKEERYIVSYVSGELSKKIFKDLLINPVGKEIFINIFKLVIQKHPDRSRSHFVKPIMDPFFLNDFLKKDHKNIVDIFAKEVIEIILEEVLNIKSEINMSRINTIEDSRFNNFPDHYPEFMVFRFRDVLMDFINKEPENTKEIIEELLLHEGIIRKIGFYIISENYNFLKDLFWVIDNPLKDRYCYQEIYLIFKNNIETIIDNDDQKVKIKKWIETYKEEDEEKPYIYYEKKKWLNIFKDKNKEFYDMYNIYNEKNSAEIKYEDFLPRIEVFLDNSYKENKYKDINKLSVHEFIEYFNCEKEDNIKHAIAKSLLSLVKENNEKYLKDIKLFLNSELYLNYYLFAGFLELIREGKFDKKIELLDYIGKYSNKINFKKKYKDDEFEIKLYPNEIKYIILEIIENILGKYSLKNRLIIKEIEKMHKILLELKSNPKFWGKLNKNDPITFKSSHSNCR
ncbi:hypothetical protein KAU33_12895, partial [Candidatus Dependentiae bacterium]|nr:hypothetical protein [Candidatus Dependentiae bacterium]